MTSTWHSLEVESDAVAATTAREASATCALLQQSISTLADGFTEAEVVDSEPACAQMGLFSQNLNSLKCCADLAMRGYYTQSTGLLRGVYENWIAFHYIAQAPAQAHLWLCRDHRPPKHDAMLKSLGSDFLEQETDARGWYGALCRFAHTDSLVVLPHLGSHDGEPCAFFGAKFKPDLFRTCAYAISVFTGIMLREVSGLIPADAAWQQSCNTAVQQLLKYIQDENETSGRD